MSQVVKVCLELPIESAELLAVLAFSDAIGPTPIRLPDKVIRVLEHLADSAADGVRRPGSWERGWLEQAFGSWPDELLETDPECAFYRRPATGGGR